MGTKDFAGGTVVRISSGTSAFALASLLGARKERAESFPANLPFVILGGGILWLGWTGFNGGSAFAANGDCGLAIATTYVAAAAAMVMWITVERILDGAPTSIGAMSGAVAGLVNITPCAGFVEPLGALGVGAIGALCCVFAARGLKKLNLVDDSLDCFSLHGVGGFAGAILGGFFDLGDGLIYGGDGLLLAKNLAGAAFGVVYSAAVTAVIFGLMRVVMRMRVSEEQELEGVDINCHSKAAYGKTEGFGEHSHRMTPETAETAPTLLTVPSPRGPRRPSQRSPRKSEHVSSTEKPTEV
ncbi:nrgA [Symbiodinium necroappetens]|uniref:NrgA protein n=1 Tax=Symbiodinium necroappetens TaxID=1628268 RepID=A0A813BB28_9DINO|nr:nrgA [Symbiodinium necroappetens]